VSCTNTITGLPLIAPGLEAHAEEGDTAPLIGIEVKVAKSASGTVTNRVSVSGGGAAGIAADSLPTTISFSPAGFGLERFSQSAVNRDGSPATQSGSHPYAMTTSFTVDNMPAAGLFNPVGELKDVEVDLPAGFVGNPNATPKCPRALFDEGRNNTSNALPLCPVDTEIGTEVASFLSPTFFLELPVYNLVPPPGMPAQFGFAFGERVGFINAGVRTGAGYRLKVNLRDIVQQGILSSSLTLWGVPADPAHNSERGINVGEGAPDGAEVKPFLTMPGSCEGPLTNTLTADSWPEPGTFLTGTFGPQSYVSLDNQGNPFAMQGCEKLNFSPTIQARPETTAANTPTGLQFDVHFPQNESPESLAEADLKNVTVALPTGVTISPSQANGLQACSQAQIGLKNESEPSCPNASKIGSVEVSSPLLADPLIGSVYVAQQGNLAGNGSNPFGSLLAIYVTAQADGALIKLAGQVSLAPDTGQITTTFTNNPQLPFTDFKLSFFGGPRAALVTPSGCGTYTTTSSLTGYNEASATPQDQFKIASGCTMGFSPAFAAGMTATAQAGGFSPFSTSISRSDQDQNLAGVSVRTPPGLLGVLKSVARCPEPQAAEGACGPESLIGHTTVGAGPGPDPLYVGGSVYLTGPYEGAPFGLSIVTHAVAGPFDLGNVIVRARIDIDPHTAQITVTSDPLPTIRQGIPLDIRTVNVTIDREHFTFNPTNCSPLSVTGAVASTAGAGVGVSNPFQAANCANLPFKPKFTVSTQAKTSKAAGASLDVNVTSAAGQANIGKVRVLLPKQLPARLTTLQKACVDSVFNENPAACPAASLVGTATALTPLLAHPLTGPAYLVSHGGAAFPDLIIVLQGEGIVLDLDGSTDIKKGITSSTFSSVPDAPISTFNLVLPEGSHSALATNIPAKARGSLCSMSLAMPTTIVGQNGAVVTQTTKIAILGCPKHRRKSVVKSKTRGSKR